MDIGMGDACEMLDGRDGGLDSCTEGERGGEAELGGREEELFCSIISRKERV
jgi:hypothetical protein